MTVTGRLGVCASVCGCGMVETAVWFQGQAAQLGARSSCPFPGAGAFLSAMRVTGSWQHEGGCHDRL